jgi:hypothetical protein
MQYTDTIKIKSSNWNENTSEELIYKGRKEPRGGSRSDFNNPNNTAKYIVFMPLPVADLEKETPVEVYDKNGRLLVADTIKDFERGQFNARIWL